MIWLKLLLFQQAVVTASGLQEFEAEWLTPAYSMPGTPAEKVMMHLEPRWNEQVQHLRRAHPSELTDPDARFVNGEMKPKDVWSIGDRPEKGRIHVRIFVHGEALQWPIIDPHDGKTYRKFAVILDLDKRWP